MEAWEKQLAEILVEDRQDSRPPLSREQAERMAARYAQWLRKAKGDPGPIEEVWQEQAKDWPGQLFFHLGKPTIVVAPQNHGKTNAAVFLVQNALRLYRDWDVFTNIPFPWDEEYGAAIPRPEHLYTVHSATELMEGIARTILAGRVPAVVLDESGQWLSSHDWRTAAAEAMTKFVYVERHFRLRGPILIYHHWNSVLEPFRHPGDLRGSYCRVVHLEGTYRLVRAEDPTRWWRIDFATLPYLSLGLTGFEMDVDFRELGSRLHGGLRAAAQQTLDYLSERKEEKQEDARLEALEAREAHAAALAAANEAIAEQHRARLERRESIIQAFMEHPDLSNREAQRRFQASSKYIVELRQIALDRLRGASP